MVINSINVVADKAATLSQSLLNENKHGNFPANCLVQKDFVLEDSRSSLGHRPGKYKNNLESESPYLKNSNHRVLGNSVQLVSRVTEKRFVHKNGRSILSSFPLAGNIYKVNSDEIKAKPNNKKVLKSVLTLPNNSPPITQLCTVSDLNDSEYLNGKEDLHKKIKKRNLQMHTRKFRPFAKGFGLGSQNSRDADGYLECSSNDTLKKCGDGKRIHKTADLKSRAKERVKPHDVWAILRNMNRFQFQSSPQLSEDSILVSRQKKLSNRRNNRNDMRVFETRRTEEFAYISSYKVNRSPSLSRCTSFDKVTVIDMNQDSKLGKAIEDKSKKKRTPKVLNPKPIKYMPKNRTSPVRRNNLKTITYINQTNTNKNNYPDNADKISSLVICPNYGEIKELLNNNASVDLGYESKTTENDEDFIYFDMTNTGQASPCSQSKLSDNSGSSKAAAFTKRFIHKKAKLKSNGEIEKRMNGITKVILRGQNGDSSYQSKVDPIKRNLRQTAVVPNNPVTLTPKLTKTELNRQLHKYKFPLVILGKDQIRSSIQVVSEHPQFDGLDQQIWPFMKSWYGIEAPAKVTKKQIWHNVHNKRTKIDEVDKKAPLKNNLPKFNKLIDKTPKIDHKRVPLPLADVINLAQNHKKLKPIKQLKDRMLKLLYKNSSMLNVIDKSPSTVTGNNQNNDMTLDICTTTLNKCDAINSASKVKKSRIPKYIENHPWSRAKWASDFIETVIKKIKSGTYYDHEAVNKVCKKPVIIDKKEEEIQTDTVSEGASTAHTEICTESAEQIIIPGFDNAPPALEIKTMSLNEVAVKHCGTNIMVHFDVAVPSHHLIDAKSSSSVIPIDVTKSLTKVFKCQTSIINAMLPAELCSLLPKMLRNIVDSGQHLPLFTAPIDLPCLTTISEVPMKSESFTDISIISQVTPTLSPFLPISSRLRNILDGGYFKQNDYHSLKFHIVSHPSCSIIEERQLAEELSSRFERTHLFDFECHIMRPLKLEIELKPKMPTAVIKPVANVNTCTTLMPYTACNGSISIPKSFNLVNLFETMATRINEIGMPSFKMTKINNSLEIKMNIEKTQYVPNVITLRMDNFKIDTFNECISYLSTSNVSIVTDTDETLSSPSKTIVKAFTGKTRDSNNLNSCKNKRRGYIQLYRKCKSSSHISGEKVTLLHKITNLDDFFQALGSGRLLANVFEGPSENRIMAYITEFKNWTTEINASQALLLILLANKKESTNLRRYRPMLLQGIAVKRITKAIELDMEIEVIERENLNGISRYEGISYVPASIENQDTLYEELCWIAKNTASDYQRPFDHNSEKLLRSLLEKRKQLNPSYLRVMARYVGLGLLKPPGRRQWT